MNSNKNKEWLSNAPWWLLAIFFLILAIVIYFIIYACFYGSGCIPPGEDLRKENWLSFLGDYLSFIGTVAVSCAALWQTKHYNDLDKKRREEDRMRSVQPVFSIQLSRYITDALDDYNRDIELYVNEMTIAHAGNYPISHVIVFNEYMKNLMTCNDSFLVRYGFEDITSKLEGRAIVSLTEDVFERHEKHFDMPKYFNINYDDVDGRCMCQTFKLLEHGETVYYSLEKTYEP